MGDSWVFQLFESNKGSLDKAKCFDFSRESNTCSTEINGTYLWIVHNFFFILGGGLLDSSH